MPFVRKPIASTWLAAGVVFVLSAVPFLPLLGAGFVNWDDDQNFVGNEAYRGLSWDHLSWMFTTFHYGGYHPLSWLSAAVDHAFWGMDPTGYHLTNLLLHALNAVLLFVLVRELTRLARGPAALTTPWPAAAAAVLFAVHPLRVESVAWITERRGLLAALFLIATVRFYLRAHRPDAAPRTRGRYLALALAAYLLSLLSKGLAITLPALLLVLDVYPLRRLGPAGSRGPQLVRLVLEKVPFAVLAAGVGLLARLAQVEGSAVRSWTEHDVAGRCAQTAYSLCFYVWRTLVPTDLCVMHPLEKAISWGEPRFLLAGIATAAVTAVLVVRRRRWPALLWASVAYAVLLAPVSGIAQAGPSLVAERYSYTPSMPFWALAAGALLAAAAAGAAGRPRLRAAAACLAVALAIVWSSLSFAQCSVWQDSVRLWTRAVEVHPESIMAHFKLASAVAAQGQHREAADQFRESSRLRPDFGNAWYGEGLNRYQAKDYARALEALQSARALLAGGYWLTRPAEHEMLYSLALASHGLGRWADAVGYARNALAADRSYLHAYPLLADALDKQGDRAAAVSVLEEAVGLAPGDEELRRQLESLRR